MRLERFSTILILSSCLVSNAQEEACAGVWIDVDDNTEVRTITGTQMTTQNGDVTFTITEVSSATEFRVAYKPAEDGDLVDCQGSCAAGKSMTITCDGYDPEFYKLKEDSGQPTRPTRAGVKLELSGIYSCTVEDELNTFTVIRDETTQELTQVHWKFRSYEDEDKIDIEDKSSDGVYKFCSKDYADGNFCCVMTSKTTMKCDEDDELGLKQCVWTKPEERYITTITFQGGPNKKLGMAIDDTHPAKDVVTAIIMDKDVSLDNTRLATTEMDKDIGKNAWAPTLGEAAKEGVKTNWKILQVNDRTYEGLTTKECQDDKTKICSGDELKKELQNLMQKDESFTITFDGSDGLVGKDDLPLFARCLRRALSLEGCGCNLDLRNFGDKCNQNEFKYVPKRVSDDFDELTPDEMRCGLFDDFNYPAERRYFNYDEEAEYREQLKKEKRFMKAKDMQASIENHIRLSKEKTILQRIKDIGEQQIETASSANILKKNGQDKRSTIKRFHARVDEILLHKGIDILRYGAHDVCSLLVQCVNGNEAHCPKLAEEEEAKKGREEL